MHKGAWIVYRAGSGLEFTAQIKTVHRNGDVTVKVYWPYENGKEADCGFVGDVYRIGAKNIANAEYVRPV
jgi:hypothetical protein